MPKGDSNPHFPFHSFIAFSRVSLYQPLDLFHCKPTPKMALIGHSFYLLGGELEDVHWFICLWVFDSVSS